jgi:hypothetical protein
MEVMINGFSASFNNKAAWRIASASGPGFE